VIVAHPDDETLWAGGLILSCPEYAWFIISLSRKSDPDRSQKFLHILDYYHASGGMADLEDGPEQTSLPINSIENEILRLLPGRSFDLILTHGPTGEYTRHRRHEEVSRAVTNLWQAGTIKTESLYLFAYNDDHGKELPHAIQTADRIDRLSLETQREKYRLITGIYGFDPESWEARTTPSTEAFWCFRSALEYRLWRSETEAR
jgi:LmbE family N-acetylglucosaminyl deacetylase